jgi:hypothetical protein|tara:strand:- start:190 stop:486 length:297 start_codon:yes stop_codon:yes gene_type:complete
MDKRKTKIKLTDHHRKNIILLAQEGTPIPKIAKKLYLPVNMVNQFFTKWDPQKYKPIPTCLGSKTEPYSNNEDDYGSYPTYKWEDLSQSEIDIYLKHN